MLKNPKITVLGIGNILLKDEGIGIRVVEELMQQEFPPEVSIVEGGVGGLNLIPHIEKADILIVVDCVQGGGDPGDIYCFKPEDVEEGSSIPGFQSLHDISFLDVLKMTAFYSKLPDIVIYGIEPEAIEAGMELTPKVAAVLPRVIELVREEIELKTGSKE